MTNPRVELDWHTHWCPRHLEPFRATWPAGAAIAMIELFEAAVNDERIIAAAPKETGGLAQTESLNAVLREFSPLCCLVGDEKMREIYVKAGVEPC